jgi:two-component system, OmpR family, sensor kinase
VVAGVRSALHRAVGALVDNALAHNGTGGHVTVGVRRRGDKVVLTVADDGEGLDPEVTDTLLHRFGRGEQSAGHGRRFGLGLALVREVVEAHRGRLEIDGRPGVGATVTIVLPAQER